MVLTSYISTYLQDIETRPFRVFIIITINFMRKGINLSKWYDWTSNLYERYNPEIITSSC